MGLRPAQAPTGYLPSRDRAKKCVVEVDLDRAHIVRQIFEKIAYEKWSGRKVHAWLKYEVDFKTHRGKHLSIGNIFKFAAN